MAITVYWVAQWEEFFASETGNYFLLAKCLNFSLSKKFKLKTNVKIKIAKETSQFDLIKKWLMDEWQAKRQEDWEEGQETEDERAWETQKATL